MVVNELLKKYEEFRPFTDAEAWGLFKLAAIAEAVGWSMLIAGILIGQYITPGNSAAVLIAGRVHGMFFLIYIAAVIVLSPSQRWSKKQTIVAAIASVPPYGSLLFEQWEAHKRWNFQLRQSVLLTTYASALASQPDVIVDS